MKTIHLIEGIPHTQVTTIFEPVQEIYPSDLRKCGEFRLGQIHRQKGMPCCSANGAYLDGWHSPDRSCPPYITETQAAAFNI